MRVNFRAREKREDTAPEQGKKINPLIVRLEMQKIPRKNAEKNFNQRDRYPRPNRNKTRDQREPHPNRCDKPDVLEDSVPITQANPNVIEHNKTPVHAFRANRSH